MEEEKVEIVYTQQEFVSRFGAEPIKVPPSLANRYETMGVAKILIRKPVGNVPVKTKDIEEDDNYVPEKEFLTKVAWVSGKSIKGTRLHVVGELVGFDISYFSNETFVPGKLLKFNVVVVSSDLSGFADMQKLQLKSMLFQRRIPFVYYVEGDYEDILWERFCLVRSSLNVFLVERILNRAIDNYGDTIGRSFFYDGKDPFVFFKQVDSMLAPK